MNIAVTGATGFVGRHLTSALTTYGHQVVPISRGQRVADEQPVNVTDVTALSRAFAGCDTVMHLAGVNSEREPSFHAAHVKGTAAVVEAAKRCGAQRIVMLSFLGARPMCAKSCANSRSAATPS